MAISLVHTRDRGRAPLARRQLLHEPVKLGLALTGVALAVTLVLLLLGLREGIARQATTYEDHAGADIYVGPKDAETFATPGATALPARELNRLALTPGIERAGAISDGLSVLKMHGKRIAVLLIGFDPGRIGGPWDMAEGRPPRAPGEIAVDQVLAADHGISVGDKIPLRGRALHVVGLTAETASWMTPLLFVTRGTANELQNRGDSATFFLLETAGSADSLAKRLQRQFPRLNVMTRSQIAINSRRLMTESFNATLNVMALIALGVGTMVIGLTAYGFISERRREYGALKAIGERAGRLYRLVSLQAIAIALGGLAIGLVFGRLAESVIHTIWPKFLFVSLPSHYLLLVFATLLMGLIGALVPIRMLARLDPAEVFRR
jgi:putative ABC transport system permease protein